MPRILVIEDETPILENIVEVLLLSGYEAIGAQDGLEGIELLESFQPDLILCDIMMNGMDGWQVLRHVRSNPATSSLPFIFLTALADKAAVQQGYNLGANDYITKPFLSNELLEAVETWLKDHP